MILDAEIDKAEQAVRDRLGGRTCPEMMSYNFYLGVLHGLAVANRIVGERDRRPTPSTFETESIAVISTAHISQKDLGLLEEMIGKVIPSPPFICLEYDSGVWVRTFCETPEEREADIDVALNMGLSAEAARLMRDVSEAGFTWLRLDRDGPTSDKYKVFDW